MSITKVVVIGCGRMGQHHLEDMLRMRDSTKIEALIEPSEQMRECASRIFQKHKVSLPPVYTSLDEFLAADPDVETAFIITPHNVHFTQTKACLEAGLDVLLEKPMVMNAKQARDLIDIRDRTGGVLVVAFPGSLSPAIRKAKQLITEGAIGEVFQVAGIIYQHWRKIGGWRQVPEISGGGFLFDTGSHMINTVVDILEDNVQKVFAFQDRRGAPVDLCSAITIKTEKGTFVSLTAAGDSIGCDSEIFVIGTEGLIRTGAWGEKLEIRKEEEKDFTPVDYPESKGVWEQFLNVRSGKIENPCPPEVGLRFAEVMDMINASVSCGNVVEKNAVIS